MNFKSKESCSMKKTLLSLFLGFLAAVLVSSCATENNDRPLSDLVMHMAKHVGGNVNALMLPDPVRASEGVSMMIAGREVAFYKYDLNFSKQKRKLEHIKQTGMLYISGIPFEAEVNGSFVMIDHATNLKKKELIKAFQSF